MIDKIRKFEKMVVFSLVVMMSLVLLLATVELAWIILKDIVTPPMFLLEVEELLEIFGLFMLVVIGVELLETITKTYLDQTTDHARIVMTVALIAISRKVIILEVKDHSGIELLGIAAIILALSLGYYLIRRHDGRKVEGAD